MPLASDCRQNSTPANDMIKSLAGVILCTRKKIEVNKAKLNSSA